jgi:fructose-1,6-bisphosphatase I
MEIGETLTRFIVEEGRKHPDGSGDFTELLVELTRAGKMIASEVNKAGLADMFGTTGSTNVHGETVQKLDELANDIIIKSASGTGHLAAAVSEEMEEIYKVPGEQLRGACILVFDPVDGSSNIDVNVSIGTIFSIYRKLTEGEVGVEDVLRPANECACAGYIIYGNSTMLVYTTGHGVHGFTLDTASGEFLLSHEQIRIPVRGKYCSVNESNQRGWEAGVRAYVNYLKEEDEATGRPYSSRYIGSLVADFHRNLLKGGIFLYPGDLRSPQGKLRLVYEAAPLAFVVEQAGGKASTGREDISALKPDGLHQRVPLVIGSADDVTEAEQFIQGKRELR